MRSPCCTPPPVRHYRLSLPRPAVAATASVEAAAATVPATTVFPAEIISQSSFCLPRPVCRRTPGSGHCQWSAATSRPLEPPELRSAGGVGVELPALFRVDRERPQSSGSEFWTSCLASVGRKDEGSTVAAV